MLPPLVIDVRIKEAGSRGFRIWLPFFLLWPLLLPILALVLSFTILADFALIVAGSRYHHTTALVLGALRLLSDLRGTNAHVSSPDSHVHVVIN